MKILFLSPYIPYPPDNGGRQRVLGLLREAARHNEVHLLSLCDEGGQCPPEIADLCHHVELFPYPALPPTTRRRQMLRLRPRLLQAHYSLRMQRRVTAMLAEGNFDLVHAEELVMSRYLMNEERLPPVILSRQKIDLAFEGNVMRACRWGREKVHRAAETLKVYWLEREVISRPWRHMLLTEDDAKLVRRLNPSLKTSVLRNGIDVDFFRPQPPAERPVVSFIGAMWYEPNVDAMCYFFDEIYQYLIKRVDGLRIYIVGHKPVDRIEALRRFPGVTVTGSVPDVRPYLAASALSVAPIRIGGGERTKILEAMAMGIPTVSTSIGAEGLSCTDGENISIADEPEKFAERIQQLLTDRDLRRRMSIAGREFVERSRSWPQLGQELQAIYERAVTEQRYDTEAAHPVGAGG